MSRKVLAWFAAAVAIVVTVTLAARLIAPRLAFFPSAGEDATPDLGGDYTVAFLTTADDERLRVWSLPHPAPRALILYFHGNGGNLSLWAPVLAGIREQGYSVYAIDYRGYGLSTGSPSERGLFRDVDAFVASSAARPDVPMVYWGRSLGTTMAAYAATVRPPDGIILESGFPDVRTLLRGSPLALLAPLSGYRFATAELLQRVTQPVLVMHGGADSVVPYSAGRALFDRIGGRKTFVTLHGTDHNDLAPADPDTYWSTVAAFVSSLRSARH